MKNAVLLIHGTTGTGKEFLAKDFRDAMFEPGQPLDAAKYYLIIPDAIGLGGSSNPVMGCMIDSPAFEMETENLWV